MIKVNDTYLPLGNVTALYFSNGEYRTLEVKYIECGGVKNSCAFVIDLEEEYRLRDALDHLSR